MRPTFIVLHHSLTADKQTVDWEAIRRYHTSWRFGGRIITFDEAKSLRADGKNPEAPWRDIGYHMGFEMFADPVAGPRPLALMGRPLHWLGAHTQGQNAVSWGVCFVGNWDAAVPPPSMLAYGAKHVAGLLSAAGLPASRETLRMHREFAPKTCPGTLFPYEMFLDQVKWELAHE